MSFHLHITTGPDAGRRVALLVSETLIGRGEECGVRLADPAVSRVHCKLVVQAVGSAGSQQNDGECRLVDASSRWGVRVNGQVVQECLLSPGDLIELGDTQLRLEQVGSPTSTTIERRPPEDVGDTNVLPVAIGKILPPPDEPAVPAIADVSGAAPLIVASKWLGTTFKDFRLEQVLAVTRTGVVFRADDARPLDEQMANPRPAPMAVKLFHPRQFATETAWRRFVRGVNLAVDIQHERLVQVILAGRWEGVCFTASELVEGESVAAVIQQIGVAGMLDWRTTLRIALDIAEALHAAADAGWIHRNVTPHNILVEKVSRRAKLNDLVLAKSWDDVATESLTQTGEILGEIGYQSPESLGSGQPIDQRSDLYSLGATLYALLTGRPPFEGRTAAQTIEMVLTQPPVPPTKLHLAIPALFEGTVLRLLSKRPSDRHPHAAALITELCRIAQFQGLTDFRD